MRDWDDLDWLQNLHSFSLGITLPMRDWDTFRCEKKYTIEYINGLHYLWGIETFTNKRNSSNINAANSDYITYEGLRLVDNRFNI